MLWGRYAVVAVREVVGAVIGEVAPHEVPLLEGLRGFDDARAVEVLAGGGSRREPLGFGLAEAAGLVTPVVWIVLDQMARRGIDAGAEGMAARLRPRVRRLLRRSADPPQELRLPLEGEQLALVRARILEKARDQGLSEREAEVLGDAVVARLVLPDSPAPRSTAPGAPAAADTTGTGTSPS